MLEVDETELGDDPFARGGGEGVSLDSGSEPWLKSDRDYTYEEVRQRPDSHISPIRTCADCS